MIDLFRRAAPFDTLIRPHLERLYRLGYRLAGSRDDAEDLVQELCVRLMPKVEHLRTLEQPGPWLARALHNLFVDELRHRQRSPVDAFDELPEVESPEPGPQALAEAAFTAERVQGALARLPPEQRAVIAWHDIEGYTLEELADTRTLPIGTLKSRLHRGRAALKALLMEPFDGPRRVRSRDP